MRERSRGISGNVPTLNNSGFTLIEMLLSLTMFLAIASLIPIGLRIILSDGVLETGIRRMEWQVFSEQVKKEIRSAEQLTISADKIVLKKNGTIILYEKYGSSIRRRVGYQGHEILIQNLASFQFEKIEEGVGILATDVNGDRHSTRVHYYMAKGEVIP
jgi:competence protein ComGF